MSVGLLSYQQQDTIERAFRSLVSQNYHEPLEILVADDGSTDDTPKILQALIEQYQGSHHVRNVSGSINLGLIGNVNRVFEQSNGEFVFLAAGDDLSSPDRVVECMKIFTKNSDVMAVHTKVWEINKEGVRLKERIPPVVSAHVKAEEAVLKNSILIGATGAYRAGLFEFFGPLKSPFLFEDLIFAYRAVLKGRLYYLDKPLVEYRVEEGLSSNQKFSSKKLRSDARLRGAKRSVAILEQRIHDTKLSKHPSSKALLAQLEREFNYRSMSVRFYEDNNAFWASLFSRKFLHVIRVALKEIPYQRSSKDLQL